MDETDLPPLRANAAFASTPGDVVPLFPPLSVELGAASTVVVTVLSEASRACTPTAATPPPARAATAASATIAPIRGRRSERGGEGGEGGEEEDAGKGGSWKTGRGSLKGGSFSMTVLYPDQVEDPLESGLIRVKQGCAHHVSVRRGRCADESAAHVDRGPA